MSVKVSGKLRANRSNTLHVTVVDASDDQPVSGATVSLDARKVGVRKLAKSTTDDAGVATFKHVHPTKMGKVRISVKDGNLAATKMQVKVKG